METIAIRLGFGSFFKIVFTGCLCASLVLVLLGLLMDVLLGAGGTWLRLLLAPFTAVFIGTLFGLCGYPVYRLLARRFVFFRRLTVVVDKRTTDDHPVAF